MTHSPKWPMILSFIKMRKQIFEEERHSRQRETLDQEVLEFIGAGAGGGLDSL